MPRPDGPDLPPGRALELPGRGRTFVREVTGPPGAPAVVLLHGLGASADLNWFPSYAGLGRHFRVVAIDQRGHGRGIRVGSRFRLEDCADDVVALADALGIERVIPVGYSMGGPVAQLVWRRHRERVAGLVLCATSRNFRGGPRERMMFAALPGFVAAMRMTPTPIRRGVMLRAFPNRYEDPPMRQWAYSELRRNDPAGLAAAAAQLGRFSSHQWIGEVDVPTAVVVTARDTLVPPHRQLRLAESIPDASVHIVDGDHAACVMAWRRFVPVLVEACLSVSQRSGVIQKGAPAV
jgi:pimeloyl-ACP methyl ester carboxylesterase